MQRRCCCWSMLRKEGVDEAVRVWAGREMMSQQLVCAGVVRWRRTTHPPLIGRPWSSRIDGDGEDEGLIEIFLPSRSTRRLVSPLRLQSRLDSISVLPSTQSTTPPSQEPSPPSQDNDAHPNLLLVLINTSRPSATQWLNFRRRQRHHRCTTAAARPFGRAPLPSPTKDAPRRPTRIHAYTG